MGSTVTLDDGIRDNVILVGGKVAGIDCPDCQYSSRDADLDAHSLAAVTCPDCGATVLTEDQKSQLRQAGKL